MNSIFKGRKWNKKGDLGDLITIAIIFFVFSIVVIIGYKVNDEITNKFQENSFQDGLNPYATSHINQTLSATNGMFPGVIDNSFLFLVVGLASMAIIFAAMVRIHPVFFVFYVVMLTVVIYVCGIFSNIYTEFANHPEFSDLADSLTNINAVMRYLPMFVGVFGTFLAIVMYKLYSMQFEEGV